MFESNVNNIVLGNEKLTDFWSNADGWAPLEAAELLSKSRLDRQVSLSKSLLNWTFDADCSEGDLILAWSNLGALVEGTIKLFLSVYYNDYSQDEEKFIRKGTQVDPDILTLENLLQFIRKRGLFSSEWYEFIQNVQYRRNAIHAYKDRPIGDRSEFHEYIEMYLLFMREVNNHLPYPENGYEVNF